MQKITPFLWFDNNAQESAIYYASIFSNSKIISSSPMFVELEIEGQAMLKMKKIIISDLQKAYDDNS